MMDNRRLFNWTAWGYDFITRQEIWREQIRQTLTYAQDPQGLEEVLDLGCGPGISTFVFGEALVDAKIVGVDVAEKMIRRARAHHLTSYSHLENVKFDRADVYDLPFEAESFDLAVGHSFLYLLPDRLNALRSILEVLRPGGILVLMEPNAEGTVAQALRHVEGRRWLRSPFAAGRFATSMVMWRIVSRSQGQLRKDELEGLFEGAGFYGCHVQPTLGGLGLHAVGKKRG